MRDTMPKVLDSDTESEIPASIHSNNNSEPNTDNEEKPETDALPVAGTSLPAVENGNVSDTDSICSNRSNGRMLSNGTDQTPGPSLPSVRAPTPPAATANGNSSSSCASNPNNNGNSSSSNGSTSNPTRASTATPVAAGDRIRKYRHQNFSKNIYIGTKNAEKWDTLRNLLLFKNDVEFVSFLLRLAEVDDRKRKNRIANG